MKRLLITAVCLSLSLAGCSTLLGGNTQLTADKAMFAAESSFAGLAALEDAGVKSGALHGANAAKAKTVLDDAHTALLDARTAYAAANYALAISKASSVQATVATAAPVVPTPAS